jgi:hypothetical protein
MKKRLLTALVVLTGMFLLSASIVWSAPGTMMDRTTSYMHCDDGNYQEEVTSPNPRFIVHGDRTVTDQRTGLMWAKNANLYYGSMNWNDALDSVNNLILGTSCGSSLTDWRLPSKSELESLLDLAPSDSALPTDHPFTNVYSHDYYWSSTTHMSTTHMNNYETEHMWYLHMDSGDWDYSLKTENCYVWPVRDSN